MLGMRRLSVADVQIWFATLIVGVLLGGVAAAVTGSAVVQSNAAEGLIFEALALVGAGVSLIALAVRGSLMRLFLMSFAGVFVLSTLALVR